MGTTTLKDLRTSVRQYIGLPTATQISDAELNAEINAFYVNSLPDLVYLDSLRGFHTTDIAGKDTYDVPDDVIKVFPPCLINDTIVGVFYDPTIFWAKHPGASSGVPKDVLVLGKSLFFAPAADSSGSYNLKIVALTRPEKLIDDSSVIIQDNLQDVIEAGASINILLKLGDTNSAGAVYQYFQRLTMALQSLGAAIDLQGVRDVWSNRELATSTSYGVPQAQSATTGLSNE